MAKRGGIATSGLIGSVPIPAYLAGYNTNTFTSSFINDVDLSKTLNSGFKWYPYNFFGSAPDMSKVTGTSTGGPLILQGDSTGPNGEIMTCAVKAGSYVGTAFGGGGYFESTLKFDPTTVTVGLGNGWPSFWSLSIEKGLAPTGDQWVGQAANYEHYVEPDFFEYIRRTSTTQSSYDGTIHDWSGISPSFTNVDNTAGSASTMPVSNVSLFNNYHKYGFLWIPATASARGAAQWYFDRQPVGPRVTWTQYSAAFAPPVSGQTWAYGVLDTQHLSVILGTGPGANLTVLDVNVWQASAVNNLSA